MAEEHQASPEAVERARRDILPIFRRDYEEMLRGRPNLQPQASDDDAVFGFADRAVHEYLRAMASNPALPRLSRVQLMDIRQELYASHGVRGPFGPLLSRREVEDIHIHGTRGG